MSNIKVKYTFDTKAAPDATQAAPAPPSRAARMLALDHIYPEGIHIPDYFVGKNIVHLPTVKTHMYTTTTGAMKNAFGGLLSKYRHYTHSWIHETLVDLLMIQKRIHKGLFAVMDGTFAGDGPGPRCMIPHVKNVLLASADLVFADYVDTVLSLDFLPDIFELIWRVILVGLAAWLLWHDRQNASPPWLSIAVRATP